ncbi:MAG: VWA domain-containing protein, partial [Planctomycetes bacterium]|nr:VWA domain-containing protein [Planctomycetota bacterium]
LLALGGEASFAAGGYADSPFEDLLPVSSRTGERPPVAMVVVLDASGSMNEKAGEVAKIALAKQAVLALRPALGAADRLGIVAFAGEPRVVSPLVALEAWDALRGQLLAIQAGGGTRITPAVEAAAALFGPVVAGDRTVRHVLLLSDGRSADFDAARLAAACRAGRISVSAVATGPDADRPRLAGLAEATGGRLHDTADIGRLAETFLKDLAWARGEGLRPTPHEAAWRAPAPVWPAAGPPLPAVPGYNATRPKDGADVHWATVPRESGEEAAPLLATWRQGLGKVAAMPWPVGRGAEAWLSDEAAGRCLAPVVAWLSAATVPTEWSAQLAERGGAWWVRAEERAGAVGGSSAPFVATAPAAEGDRAAAVDLVQTAPGVYEGRLPAATSGGEVVVHRRGAPQEAVHLAMPGAPPLEFRRLGVDRSALEAIVRAGGGKVHAAPESLAEAVRQVQVRGFEPAGVLLLWAAAAVAAVQVALRLLGRL